MALAMSAPTHHHPGFNNTALGAGFGETAPKEPLAEHISNSNAPQFTPATPAPGPYICPKNLKFTWENTAFVASITKDTTSKEALVTISCGVGWLAYSAENNPLRAQALAFFRDHTSSLTGQFLIAADGKVNFTQKTKVSSLGSQEEIIRALTICLLQARPYLKTVQGLLLPL